MSITKIEWGENWSTEDWESQRMLMEGINQDYTRIGASDVGHILFPSEYKCKRRLALHLIENYNTFVMTEQTLEGHLQEPLTVDRWESWDEDVIKARKQTLDRIKVRQVKKAKFFLTNSSYKSFFVSLDYIPLDDKQYSPFTGEVYKEMTPIEVKFTNKRYFQSHWSYKGYPITPQYYAQVQAQMLITDRDLAVFLVKVGDDSDKRFVPVEILRDNYFIENMIREVDIYVEQINICKIAWLRHVLCNDDNEKENLRTIYEDSLPDYGYSKDDLNLSTERWQAPIDPDAGFLKGDDKIENMMAEYVTYKGMIKTITENTNNILANLKHLSSGWEGIKTENYKAIIRGERADKGSYTKIIKVN